MQSHSSHAQGLLRPGHEGGVSPALGHPPHLSGDSAGAPCGWSCSSSRGCSGSAGEGWGAASRPPADGGPSDCGQSLQSRRLGEGEGVGSDPPPVAFGALQTVVPSQPTTPSLSTSSPRCRPRPLPRLPPRLLLPQVLPPKRPSSHMSSCSEDKPKSWTDPESHVQPLQTKMGRPRPERPLLDPDQTRSSRRALFSTWGLGCQLLLVWSPVALSTQETPQPPSS